MQVKDLGPLLNGASRRVREGLLIEQDSQTGGFGFQGPIRARTYVTERWRMSIYQGHEFAELYDLANDPHEMHNLWHTAPQRNELMRAMIDTMTALQDESPVPALHA